MRFVWMIACILCVEPLVADLDMKKMQMMVKKIKEPRVGSIKSGELNVKSPFVVVENKKIPKEMAEAKKSIQSNPILIIEQNAGVSNLDLRGTVNGQANVNGKWVGAGDSIGGYRILYISNGRIKVEKDKEVKELSVGKSKEIIKLR